MRGLLSLRPPPRSISQSLVHYRLLSSSVSLRRSLSTNMADATQSPASSAWIPSQATEPSSSSYTTFSKPLVQSPNDNRQYRIIKLHNNLQALLVSDPDTDKAAASLSVGVGHLSDPDDRPGLAHFCEHLLFMVRPLFYIHTREEGKLAKR